MNQKLPMPLRNALARQAGGEVHPSPDVLTSFIERTLPRDERDLVTYHLALCPDCREVVLLASSATEDVAVDGRELAAAAAHQPVRTPVYRNVHDQPAAWGETPRRPWTLGLSWTAAAVALLLVAGVLVWQRFASTNPARQPVSTIASNSQPPGVAQPAAAGVASAPGVLTKTTRVATTPQKTAAPKTRAGVVGGAVARKGGEGYKAEPGVAAVPAGESAQAPVSVVEEPKIAVPGPGTHNAFVESQADTSAQLGESRALAKPMMSMRAVNGARGQWRINADGQLEHRGLSDDWTRVLAEQSTTFRVVSVVGSDVWAGGDGGALFRSPDAGQHWSRVPLIASSGAETGTIVSIQFKDSLHGTVLTAGGARWTTSDGGVTWTSK
jgi:Photosynthesis system II assembly factor YCF48